MAPVTASRAHLKFIITLQLSGWQQADESQDRDTVTVPQLTGYSVNPFFLSLTDTTPTMSLKELVREKFLQVIRSVPGGATGFKVLSPCAPRRVLLCTPALVRA